MDIITLTTVNEFKSSSLALIRIQENGFQGHSPKSEIRLIRLNKPNNCKHYEYIHMIQVQNSYVIKRKEGLQILQISTIEGKYDHTHSKCLIPYCNIFAYIM